MASTDFYRMRRSQGEELAALTREVVASLLSEGQRVSFYSVSERSGIARSTLYRRDDLRQLVDMGRDAHQKAKGCSARSSAEPSRSPTEELQARLARVTFERDLLLQERDKSLRNRTKHGQWYALVRFGEVA